MNGAGSSPVSPEAPQRLSLSVLRHLSCQVRFERILESGRDDLVAALKADRPQGTRRMGVERLAWAVAFNVEGSPVDGSESPGTSRAIRGYCDRWPHETTWATIWDALTKPLARDEDGSPTLLSELAWSVACEHRDDWQYPRARPIDVAEANGSFETVYLGNKGKVVGNVYRSFGQRAGSPEAIADEAWSRVFCDYWSLTARRRFLGLSRISTLVCQVARYVALDTIRDQAGTAVNESSQGDESPNRRPSLEDLGIADDPADALMAAELASQIKACMSQLPARQRIVAEMVWFRQIRAKRAAEILRISEPAVSQHLKKAREAIGRCLNRDVKQEGPATLLNYERRRTTE